MTFSSVHLIASRWLARRRALAAANAAIAAELAALGADLHDMEYAHFLHGRPSVRAIAFYRHSAEARIEWLRTARDRSAGARTRVQLTGDVLEPSGLGIILGGVLAGLTGYGWLALLIAAAGALTFTVGVVLAFAPARERRAAGCSRR